MQRVGREMRSTVDGHSVGGSVRRSTVRGSRSRRRGQQQPTAKGRAHDHRGFTG